METKIELYLCERCGKAVSKPVSLYPDKDTPFCQQCADYLEARADSQWEAQKEDDILNDTIL